ncbi:MAG: hypothetical protein HF978_09960 [Desulfobacteraceae bacterium]|nr:hypothetical protein [Desulfobacteraceae bacterium]MBC2755860.1 hypothetical protein [Desulfobacteraceae bacterium]
MRNKKEPNTRKRIAVGGGMVALAIVLTATWLTFNGDASNPDVNPVTAVSPTAATSASKALHTVNDSAAMEAEPVRPDLELRLLATTVSLDSNEAYSRATIEDINRERRHIMRTGQLLRGYEDVVLVEIATDRVVLENGGRPEVVFLDDTVPLNPRKEVWPVEIDLFPDAENPADITEDVFLHGLARQIAVLQTQRTALALGHQGAFAPWEENGEFIGLFTSSVVEGSFFDQLGLRQGDILMSINGYDIKSAADNVIVLDILTHETRLYFRVRGIDGEEREFETQTVPVM